MAYTLGGRVGELDAPRRNNYFYGKLMDVLHFQMEQEYGINKRWLLNRLALGEGVLCGLNVVQPAPDSKQLCITPGVAIDALGREIIVPGNVFIDPWQLVDRCGHVTETLPGKENYTVEICLAYNECNTEHMPVAVADCNTRGQCAPGTTVEAYCFLVKRIQNKPDPQDVNTTLCDALSQKTTAKRRSNLCQDLPDAPSASIDPPCVCLATVTLLDGAITEIDTCTCRPIVYSNAMLLELILCLAERVEECCGTHSSPTPLLRVNGVQFMKVAQGNFTPIISMRAPTELVELDEVQAVNAIQVDFVGLQLDHKSVEAGKSFLVQNSLRADVPGKIVKVANNAVRFEANDNFALGEYYVTLKGSGNSPIRAQGSAGQVGDPLDGDLRDPTNFPSGDGAPGGDFEFKFAVVD